MRHKALAASRNMEAMMNEDVFNVSIRKFLKVVGIGSQREIERAVGQAIADGAISGNERFPARMTLVVNGLNIDVAFDGEIKLE
jgi:hypothetical protein